MLFQLTKQPTTTTIVWQMRCNIRAIRLFSIRIACGEQHQRQQQHKKNESTVFFPLTNRNEFSRMLLLFYTHTNTRCWPSPPTKHNQWYFDLRLSFRKCSHSLYSTPHEWYDDVVFYTRARNISYTQPAAHIVGEPVLFYF